MQPVRKRLGGIRQVVLSPDADLNLLPFAALVDEGNRYLVERYSFRYLTSGRDLLRLKQTFESRQSAMVFADPDFGGDTTRCSDRALKIQAGTVDFFKVLFCPLDGTAGEARALKTLMPNANVLTRDQATEAAVGHVTAPRILHIATHGFFLQDVVTKSAATNRLLLIDSGISGIASKIENPLLRSGLALAGANLHKSGNDDGILTALEVAGLNLWGTKLVVLSACDTGVGEVRNGDGVYGLRRALLLAGSESQVMSLWPVSDFSTRDLMIGYYRRLQAGEGRSEALRRVQLRMLHSAKRRHPYYWASFIESGEWANLDGKR
jgi:CHAT domain-containing protein